MIHGVSRGFFLLYTLPSKKLVETQVRSCVSTMLVMPMQGTPDYGLETYQDSVDEVGHVGDIHNGIR